MPDQIVFHKNVPEFPTLDGFRDIRNLKTSECSAFYKACREHLNHENRRYTNAIMIDDFSITDDNEVLEDFDSIYFTTGDSQEENVTISSVKEFIKSEFNRLDSPNTYVGRRFLAILAEEYDLHLFCNDNEDDYFICANKNSSFLEGDIFKFKYYVVHDAKVVFSTSQGEHTLSPKDFKMYFKKMRAKKNEKKTIEIGDLFKVKESFTFKSKSYDVGEIFEVIPRLSYEFRRRYSLVKYDCQNRIVTEEELQDQDYVRISNGYFISKSYLNKYFDKLEEYDDTEEVWEMARRKYKERKLKKLDDVLVYKEFDKAQDKEISSLIEAGYPLINIVSYEEKRVLDLLEIISGKYNFRMNVWSVISGYEQNIIGKEKEMKDPLDALKYITNFNLRGKAVFVLKDYHKYIGQYSDPQIIRSLRDIIETHNNKVVIILSPVQDIPIELKKDVATVNYGLPNVKELVKLLGEIKQQIRHVKKLRITKRRAKSLAEAALGLTVNEAKKVFIKSLMSLEKGMTDECRERVLEEKAHTVKSSGLLDYFKTDVKFEDIGGLEVLKEWLVKRSNSFSKEARNYGLPFPKGILLLGVPGCGKSMIAKGLGNLWKVPVVKLDIGKVMGSLVGESEKNMREVINTVDALGRCILFVDEIEKGFSGTESSGKCDAGTKMNVYGTFLTWMQDKKDSFLIATANNISELDPAFLRKGRFDENFFVDLPDLEERKKIFEIHLKKVGRNPDKFNLENLTKKTKGYTGAEIEQIIAEAMHEAFNDGIREFKDEDLFLAIKNVTPIAHTMPEKIDELREWRKGRARLASYRKQKDEIVDEQD